METPELKKCLVFSNGMVIAFDQKGEQRPDYQGQLHEVEEKIRRDFPKVTIEPSLFR